MTTRGMVRVGGVPQTSCEEITMRENDLIGSIEIGRVDSSRDSGKDEVEESFSRHI